jgi:N-acetylmuramoyl-L-alanine amidase
MNTLPYANYTPSPNHGSILAKPKFIVLHFTAGSSLASSTQWLCSARSKASAHVIVGKDGTVNQLVPFNAIAWHAGESVWRGFTGLNKYAIGIELDNMGPLVKGPDGSLRSVPGGPVVQPEDAFYGAHKNGGAFRWWDKYPQAQLDKLARVVADVCKEFPSITEIVGHDDIAPKRKVDVGPAFGVSLPQTPKDFLQAIAK